MALITQQDIVRMMKYFDITYKEIAGWLFCDPSVISHTARHNKPLPFSVDRFYDLIFVEKLPKALSIDQMGLLNVHIMPYLRENDFLFEEFEVIKSQGYETFIKTMLRFAWYNLSFAKPNKVHYRRLFTRNLFTEYRREALRLKCKLSCQLNSEMLEQFEELCSYYERFISQNERMANNYFDMLSSFFSGSSSDDDYDDDEYDDEEED